MKTAIGVMNEDAFLFDVDEKLDGVSLRYRKRNIPSCYYGTKKENIPFWEKLKKGVKIKIFYDKMSFVDHVELKDK